MNKILTNEDKMSKIQELESLAYEIKTHLGSRKRPLVVEFSGLPKAGKTTAVNSLALFLRRNEIPVKVVTERASVCPIKQKDHPFFNVWTGCTSLVNILEYLDTKEYRVVIVDRGIFDSIIWMKLLNNLERLNPDELEIIVKFLLLPRWCKDVDLLICMKTTIQSALDREFTDLLTRKPGSIMNQEVLSKYLEAEEQVLTNYLPQHTKIVHIDTTNLKTFLGVEIITRSVLIELKELSDEEITFIPINILREKLDFVGFESNKELLKMLIKQILIHPQHLKRSIVESDQTKVQIVVCTIIKCGTNILLFKKKEISADQRFNDKHMIWIGGHLRKDDYIDMSPPNVEKAFKSCLRRELEEEINYCGNAELEFKGLVYDKTNFRSLQHLAVVYIMNIKDISVMQSLHKKTFRELAGQQLEAEFIDLSEQNSFFNVQSVEPWSCDMLQSLFNISIHPSKREQQLLLLL